MEKSAFIQYVEQFADAVGIDIVAIRTQIGNLLGLTTNHKTTLVGAINEVDSKVGVLGGLRLESDQANSQLLLKDGNGNVLSNLDVAFLNNEGTTFNLNQATGRIELLNDQGQVLSSADLQSFIKNMIVNASFQNVNKHVLEFFTSDGSTAFTVPFKIESIQGLQAVLDAITNNIGDLTALTTTNKNDLVGAINEVNSKVGVLKKQTINLSVGYDQNTWYPVVANVGMPFLGLINIRVENTLGSSGVPSWAAHSAGFVVDFELETKAGGWGTTSGQTRLIRNNFNWLSEWDEDKLPVGYEQLDNASLPVIYLRGGGIYDILVDYDTDWDVKTTAYTISLQTVNVSSFRILSFNENKVFHAIKSNDIDTYIYGNAQKWWEAFMRGDFRDYGLGRDILNLGEVQITDPTTTYVKSGFYAINSVPNYHFAYGASIFGRKNNSEWLELATDVVAGNFYVRSNITGLLKLFTEANFNPNNYIPTSHPVYNVTQANINGWQTYLGYEDIRYIYPDSIGVEKLKFGFTNWYNNGNQGGHYADFLHFGGYHDSSGGVQNLIMFSKMGFGLRQYQGTHQSPSKYQSYVDYWHTGNFNPAQYVLQSSLNTQLNNYATKAGTQTFTGQNTFTQAIYTPAATLNGHAVNLGQLNTILNAYALASAVPTNNNQLTNGAGYITASALGGYVQQSSLNTQLANYVTLGSVQTITATKTFTVSPIVPNGTLSGHTVNLGQMQAYVASQIPGNSGIERIQTDNSTNPGPAEQPTLYFNFHEYMGMPETDTSQDLPGNMTARASGHQLDFFGSYDNKETIIEDAPFALDFPKYRKHIIDLHLTTAGDVYVADGMFTGDQVNIVTHRGAQINLDGNIHFLNAVGAHEFFSFVNLEWDASAKMWNVTAFN